MPSIALFSQSFTRQNEILEGLSAAMKCSVVTDDHIITNVSAEHAIDEKKIRHSLYEKTSVFNQFTLEKERHINLLKIEVASRLSKPSQCIYTGFHALLIPKKVTHILKVLVADEKSQRVMQAMAEGLSEKEAKRKIKQNDISAYSWTDFLFRKEAIDRSLYDMILPVGNQPLEKSVKLIIDNCHKTSILETEESKQAVADMMLAAMVEKALLQKGHKIDVTVDQSNVTLEVNKSVFNFNSLASELKKITEGIDGVKNIEVIRGREYETSVYRGQRFELPSKVLLVDDEKELVQTLSERLISRDVGTYAVFDGKQALDLIDDDKPEIMVLDLRMPGIDGIEVLRRSKQKNPEIEIIILTGHGTEDDRQLCMELGAFAYLQKPVDLEDLSNTIQEAHVKVRRLQA
jgi:two-component system, OmpR family, response regulator CpxR